MFLTKQRWIWKKWERFVSIIHQKINTSFIFYTGIMVWEKCKKSMIFFLFGPMMDKKISNIFQIHLFLARNIFLSKTSPRCGKWLGPWNEFLENDGGMMFMSWYGLITSNMTHHMDILILFLFSIENPSLVGRGN